MKALSIIVAVLCVCSCQAFLESIFGSSRSPAWDGLKVGFGVNPFSRSTFAALPRTVDDAVKAGWVRDTTVACGGRSPYQGNRYIASDGDTGAMLLFDKNGYIAGIQAGIPKNSDPNKYPNPNNRAHHVFNEEPNMMVTTAYFVEPSIICSTGRSQKDWNDDGTGTMLAIQVGSTSASLMRFPMDQSNVTSTTKFIDGKCFYFMGMHFWYRYDPSLPNEDQPCDKTFPVFLLYNRGKLNGFGWAFNPNYSNSWRWEHPKKSSFGAFMIDPPKCLGNDGPTSTLHVYLTNSPSTNFC